MRPITMFRAAAWLGVAIVISSLVLVRWGADPNLPPGPPAHWERSVVGACLLALIAAMALSLSGRKKIPPSWTARAIAAAAAALVLGIALWLRRDAFATGFVPDLLGGQGWIWLTAGSSMLVGAVIGTFGLKKPRGPKKPRRRR